MNTTWLYHGSNVVVGTPKIMLNGHYKDFGYGFYCTRLEKQAKRWALTKRGEIVTFIRRKKISNFAFLKK